jgi:hypothetical protein
MTTTAFAGPVIVFGQSPVGAPTPEYNPNAGTSFSYGGWGVLDTRLAWTYKPGGGGGRYVCGWLGNSNIQTLNSVPYTKAVQAIAANANVVLNTPMVLVSAASATTGVSIVTQITNSATGVIDTNSGAGFVGIDTYSSVTATIAGNVLTVTAVTSPTLSIGAAILTIAGTLTGATPVGMAILDYGTGTGGIGTYILNGTPGSVTTGTVTLQTTGSFSNTIPSTGSTGGPFQWNPQALTARVVAVTAAAGASGAVVFTIKGYDIYGYPMIEQITAAANTQTLGKKAFKYIKSVTPSATDAQNYSVDTTDLFGFPIRSDFFGDVLINYSASLTGPAIITASAGYTASVQTTPSATTGDVRGTYTLQTASATNTNRLMIRQTPEPYSVTNDTGLYGATQFATGF